MSDDILAYRMIKSANLSDQDERVVKATCKLDYVEVKDKLKSIYGDAGSSKSDFQCNIKTEEFLTLPMNARTVLKILQCL